jgi:hypothetical protein
MLVNIPAPWSIWVYNKKDMAYLSRTSLNCPCTPNFTPICQPPYVSQVLQPDFGKNKICWEPQRLDEIGEVGSLKKKKLIATLEKNQNS